MAKNLTTLVRTADQPFTLALDGPFGSGKTTFSKMWMAQLENEGHVCFHFNAWEHDSAADPLAAFIGEIQGKIDTKKIELDDKPRARMAWETVKGAGSKLLKYAAPVLVKVATHGLVDVTGAAAVADGFADVASKSVETQIAAYSERKKALTSFRGNLERFAEEVVTSGSSKKPLVFFIDELDRCRPTFAIELLERIKHLLNVPGFVFVLCMHRVQLVGSFRGVYGVGLDGDGYLRRFIDLELRLPEPNRDEFCLFLWQEHRIGEAFTNRHAAADDQEALLEIARLSARFFNFSLRQIEHYFARLNVVLRATPKNHKLFVWPLALLLAIRMEDAELFHRYAAGSIGAAELFRAMKTGRDSSLFQHRSMEIAEAYLRLWSQVAGELAEYVQDLKRRVGDVQADPRSTIKMGPDESALECIQWVSGHGHDRSALGYVISRIEFTDQFFAAAAI